VRPIELRLRNFRSYFGDEATFDFRDRRLIGIVGPIGSGKSSILDAIAFALFGKTPAVGRGTKALIHQRADNAAVAFRFSVEGEVWEAQRMLRAKGASQHALYRFEDDADGAEKLELITGESEVTTKVTELLGLDFDAFGRSVLLAQGRFAEFLTARPAERDKVLKGVFGHDRIDRMRAVAKERARDAEIEAEKAMVTVNHLAEVEASLATQREKLETAREQRDALEAVAPRIQELEASIDGADREQVAAQATLDELRTLSASLPDQEQASATVAASLGASDRRNTAAGALAASRAAFEAAERRAAGAAGIREKLAAIDALAARREIHVAAVSDAEHALERGAERHEQAVAEEAGQVDRVRLAERKAAEAIERLAAAEEAYHDRLHANMAATLRAELHEGEACPVCSQMVATIPPDELADGAGSAVDGAREERRRAEATNTAAAGTLEAAKTAAGDAARRRQEAAVAIVELEDRADQARLAVESATAELVATVGDEAVDIAVAAMREEVAASAADLEAAALARDRAIGDHDAAIEAEQSAGRRLSDLRVSLAAIAAKVELELAPGDDPTAIGEAADALRAAVEQADHDAMKRREQAVSLAEEHRAVLRALAEQVGMSGSLDEALGAVRSRVEVLAEEIGRGQGQLARKDEVTEQRDEWLAAMKTFQTLAGDLTDARFVRYLLDDERRRLAELGSEHFQRLSNGRYRFTDDGVFDIVDLTTADAVRKADSLSGGETFLASLGLALALAEIVSRGGGRLDAFFLDEGFGTLDPEHFDLAMEGIESLVEDEGSRLVVVVSHVPEMRHRIEDLIELDRSPSTGDTRILSA
jgi:DNA repair protein SbcC/Rad50